MPSRGTGGKGDWALNAIVAPLILLLTGIISVSVGVIGAYWVLNTLLLALGHQQRETAPAPVLIQNHASGD
jgi:hypothetical protein